MSALTDRIAEGLMKIESDLNNPTFNWAGEDFFCINSSADDRKTLDSGPGGFFDDANVILIARKEQFNEVFPKSQDKIIFNDEVYRITMVKHEPFGVFMRIFCSSDTRGI